MTESRDPLARLRAIITAWPETREKLSHGTPTWWGGRKTFATFTDDHHGDGRIAVWVKSTFDRQQVDQQRPNLDPSENTGTVRYRSDGDAGNRAQRGYAGRSADTEREDDS